MPEAYCRGGRFAEGCKLMLYTTFNLARKARACTESYRNLGAAMGGITTYGKDNPIPLTTVVEVCGLDDAIWCLRCTTTDSRAFRFEFIRRVTEHIYEKQHPNDKQLRRAIEDARACIADESTVRATVSMVVACCAAAKDAAAGHAIGVAAIDAVAAEKQWQTQQFKELLEATE